MKLLMYPVLLFFALLFLTMLFGGWGFLIFIFVVGFDIIVKFFKLLARLFK